MFLRSAARVCVVSRSSFVSRTTAFTPRSFNVSYTPTTSFINTNTFRSYCNEKTPGLKTPEEITQRVISVVKNFEKVQSDLVNDKSHFSNDLGLDSLDNVELVLAIEEEFSIEIPDEAANKITSVPEAVAYLATHPHIQ